MSNDQTKPEFFALWSLRQLQVECARLNGVLNEVVEITDKNLEKITPSNMSNCCSAAVYDPSGEGIEGRCMDCKEMCSIVKETV